MEAIIWRVQQYGGWVAGCIGAILAWFAGFDLIEHFIHDQDRLSLTANIYVVVSAAAVVIFTAIRQWSTIRKERYANITPIIHQLIHQIRDLNTFVTLNEPVGGSYADYKRFTGDCKMFFGRILDQLNTIFSSLTSTHCRTSIKLTYGGDPLYVYTLARDQGSRQKCLKMDNKRVETNHDPLTQNLQFAKLFSDSDESWHYICNDLTRAQDFQCTSTTAYAPDYAMRLADGRRRWLARKWPLPYKSTIACVIRQGPIDLCQDVKTEVLGFLTVDSESRGVFEERWDVQIMFAVADALYGPVRAYLDAQNRAPPET
jgi:hypothetical protein